MATVITIIGVFFGIGAVFFAIDGFITRRNVLAIIEERKSNSHKRALTEQAHAEISRSDPENQQKQLIQELRNHIVEQSDQHRKLSEELRQSHDELQYFRSLGRHQLLAELLSDYRSVELPFFANPNPRHWAVKEQFGLQQPTVLEFQQGSAFGSRFRDKHDWQHFTHTISSTIENDLMEKKARFAATLPGTPPNTFATTKSSAKKTQEFREELTSTGTVKQ